MIYWLMFARFSDGSIVPIRSIDEGGDNFFGSGENSGILFGETVDVCLCDFESRKDRENFIDKFLNKKYRLYDRDVSSGKYEYDPNRKTIFSHQHATEYINKLDNILPRWKPLNDACKVYSDTVYIIGGNPIITGV